MGIGFAIPSNMVKTVMEQFIEYGEVERGVLGVTILGLTPDHSRVARPVQRRRGSPGAQVVEGSPAARAGVEAGDVITSVDGKPVKGAAELRNLIGMARIGEKVELGLVREGKASKVTAVIGEQTDLAGEASELHPALEGADLGDAPPEQVSGGGVQVRSVAPGSPAAMIGLRANDVIVGVDRTRVANVTALKNAIGEKDSFLLTLRRGSQTVILPVG